jgi:hypothetical protein
MRVEAQQNGRLRAAERTIIGVNGTRVIPSLSTRRLERKGSSLPVIPVELEQRNDKVRVNIRSF